MNNVKLIVGNVANLGDMPAGSVGEFVRSRSWWSKQIFVVADVIGDSSVCAFIGASSRLSHDQKAVYLGRGKLVPSHFEMETP